MLSIVGNLSEAMIKTNVYEKDGKTYSSQSLIKAAKGLPIKMMNVNKILDTKIYWTLNTFFDLKVHLERIESSDLKYPVIVGPNNKVIDGFHRVMKSIIQGKKTVKYVKLDKLPEPDKVGKYK